MTEEQRKNLQPGDLFRAPNGQVYKVTKVLKDHLTAHPLHCEDNVFADFPSLELVDKLYPSPLAMTMCNPAYNRR